MVLLQQVFDDRQTQPGTTRLTRAADIDAIKPLSQSRQMLRHDTDAGIGDLEVDTAGYGKQSNMNLTTRRRVAHGIHDQVSDGTMQIGLIEVNVNNLAAVPPIVFGLLGLAVFINFFGVPRSAPLAGGLVLTLMTLPTIIISSRAVICRVGAGLQQWSGRWTCIFLHSTSCKLFFQTLQPGLDILRLGQADPWKLAYLYKSTDDFTLTVVMCNQPYARILRLDDFAWS